MSTLPPFVLGRGHAPVPHGGSGAIGPALAGAVTSSLGLVDLPVMPPVQPMLAKAVKGVPDPEKFGGLSFEPKWDGFRAIVFRDGDEVEFTSRNTKPLTRYFPELVDGGAGAAARALRARRRDLRARIGQAAGVRDAAGADPPGEVAHRHARREDAGQLRGLRPARARRHVVRRPAVLRAPGRARGAARRPERPVLPDPHHRRPGDGRGVVRAVRGRRARRGDREAAARAVQAERPHHDEDQARAHRRRGAGRLPRAQDLHPRAAAARQPAARPVRRRQAAARRRLAPASPRPGGPS